jgi:hypothetical protein
MTSWTVDDVFINPGRHDSVPAHYPESYLRKRYTPEFLAAFDTETEWIATTEAPAIPSDERPKFADPAHICSLCGDRRSMGFVVRGAVSGIELRTVRQCECQQARLFWFHWREVPQRYREVRLSTLTPTELIRMPLKKQAAFIEFIKGSVERSMILQGAAKTGKTHILMAMFRRACGDRVTECFLKRDAWNGTFGVWRVNTSVWLEEVIKWNSPDRDDDAEPPELSTKRIASVVKAGLVPRVFLEEIDKFKASEYKLIRLFEIVNAIYEAGGQLVATSNTPVAELAAAWGGRYGETILRRIGDEPDGLTLNFALE